MASVDLHENDGTDRPRHEGKAEDRKTVKSAGQRVHEGEHHGREHQDGGDPVDEEVEGFRRPSDHHAERDLAGRDAVRVVRHEPRVAFQRR